MRDFGKIKLSNRDYERVVKAYIRFWREHKRGMNDCRDCPLDNIDVKIINKKALAALASKYYCAICQVLPMFPDDSCPCHTMQRKAFDALDEFIKIYGKEYL